MFQRRKHDVRFSPIVNKENINFLNYCQNGLGNNDKKKKFILRLDNQQKQTPKESKVKNGEDSEEKQKDLIKLFDFKTLRKPIKPEDLPPTQCPHVSKKYSKSSISLPISNITPKFLDFSDDKSATKEEINSKWKIQTVKVLPPCQGLTYNLEDSDEEIEMWHRKFEEYDMEEDKENMPLSDEEAQIDSDLQENQSLLTNDSQQQVTEANQRRLIQRYSIDLMSKKKLQQIDEVEEASTINVSEIGK